MGSSHRNHSAHMADIKGKGILYDDDDQLIKLTSQDDPTILDEFSLSLIGKILNPKKQNVEKLLHKMPSHWGLADRITANYLGNGKFLLNFTTEEDLQSVLRQGPFHFNFCMVVLIRWEPIVHDDYPWIIPFSVDIRRPLKFSRKAESPERDEVTLEIKYEMLFKHCSTCGMLTHEKEYCPSLDVKNRIQPQTERHGVFTQVQVPLDQRHNQSISHQNNGTQPRYGNEISHGRFNQSRSSIYGSCDRKYDEESNYRRSHSDRIMRRRDDHSMSWRLGHVDKVEHTKGRMLIQVDTRRPLKFSRKAESPEGDEVTLEIKYEMLFKLCSTCERHGVLTRVQVPLDQRYNQSISHQNNGTQFRYGNEISHGRYNQSRSSRYDSSDRKYDEESNYRRSHSDRIMRRRDNHSRKAPVTRRLASTIVTPSRVDIPIEENVTKRVKEATRALSFPALSDQELQDGVGDKQIIGAVSDMEIADPHDGEMMECDVRDDDFLGQELTEMESLGSRQASVKIGRSDDKTSRSRRNDA
ncbi:hypothetical protein F2Q69_00047379 [Brassica cretica]|uniref:DUF4283 domain-containing protein n=1 Tax=Brassica cretica TaxID=69181 RepID=A0A8S9PWC8_BRACR|nr:hypothetical protein F2Q69_00047379 [Brassica cretica]